jgi:hypothetical protein
MAKYDIHKGQFVCHTCKEVVYSMRWYYEIKEMSWMCKQGHVSEVSLNLKKKRDASDREIGE